MKINKSKLLRALKADLKASEPMHDDLQGKIEGWISAYNGEPYGNEQKGKSAIVSRDIKKQSEWQHSTIIDPFVSAVDIIKATPVTAEDVESARQNELVLNTQFCRQFNRYNFMTKAAKVLDMEGTAVIQCGWDYEDEEVEVEVPIIGRMPDGSEMILGTQTVMETRIITNKPTAIVCRNEDIYIDPTCMDDMDKCQFVIYRYETDMSTLKQDGRYKNLDKVARGSLGENEVDFDSEDETEFRFEDDPRKKKVVYEYWGNYDIDGDGITEPIVCTWIDDVVIRLEDNPYPDGKPPFIVVPFNSVPFQMHGEANAELIGDNQKIKTAITRGIIDNMAQSNNGQKGIRKGALDVANRRKFINGENFEFNGTPNDFWDGSYNSIPGSAFDMLGMMNNEIESITGVKSFSGGLTGSSLGSTATGARGALDAQSTRRLNIVRNISENLVKPLMRKWMSYNAEFLDDTEVVRMTNNEFVEIRRDDLEGNIDIEITVSTNEDNAAKAQEITFMLQTQGQDMSDEMKYKMLAQWADLTKQPELAQEYRSWQPPQPTETQMRMEAAAVRKVELENMKLEAEINDRNARAQENQIDAFAKEAKARKEMASARKIESEADRIDLDFLERDSGIAHARKMEEKEFDRLSKLDEKAFDAMHGKEKGTK